MRGRASLPFTEFQFDDAFRRAQLILHSAGSQPRRRRFQAWRE
jgi:hypothetical protein